MYAFVVVEVVDVRREGVDIEKPATAMFANRHMGFLEVPNELISRWKNKCAMVAFEIVLSLHMVIQVFRSDKCSMVAVLTLQNVRFVVMFFQSVRIREYLGAVRALEIVHPLEMLIQLFASIHFHHFYLTKLARENMMLFMVTIQRFLTPIGRVAAFTLEIVHSLDMLITLFPSNQYFLTPWTMESMILFTVRVQKLLT